MFKDIIVNTKECVQTKRERDTPKEEEVKNCSYTECYLFKLCRLFMRKLKFKTHPHPHTIITISARKYFSLVAIASVWAASPAPLLPRRQKRARNLRYRIGHRPRRSVSICTLSRNYPKKKVCFTGAKVRNNSF